MEKIILPPKYYLAHFFEFINFIELHYRRILRPEQILFLENFKGLSEEAQCTYIRMINRKGCIFEIKTFLKYSEIKNIHTALEELRSKDFINSLNEMHHLDLLSFLTKAKLRKWLLANGIESPPTISRDELVSIGKKNSTRLKYQNLDDPHNLIIQGQPHTMQYLLFLYFGKIQKSLTLYTLRDLGIRQSQTLKNEFKPRFLSAAQAESDYFFAKHLDSSLIELSEAELKSLYQSSLLYSHLSGSTQCLKDELLYRLAEIFQNFDQDLALAAFSESGYPDAREKKARHLYRLDRKTECLNLLEEIQNEPRSDEELLFAEDFSARKFNKKRKGNLTEILHNSPEVELSDFYLKRPELGICKHFESLGYNAQFTENDLWNRFFGILFWDELFESENAAIHNPFERTPADLVGDDFYNNHKTPLEVKLALLKNADETIKNLLACITKNYGRLNDIFRWSSGIAESLTSFTKNSQSNDLALILRTMSQKFSTHHTGYPDLMIEKNNVLKFIEVKAEGDTLRAGQLSRMRLLKEAGFEVEVLRVRWKTDPNQTYVVVDVETTGGSASFHRVTEVGAVKIQNGEVIAEFQTLINPGRSIPSFITGITGISDAMVADAPTFSEIADPFLEFMEGSIFVAHNVKFDYGFIQREFAKSGIEFVRAHLCTCAGMRKTHPGLKSYGLKNLSEHFQIKLSQHHRALSDARAAAELLILINQKRGAVETRNEILV